MLKWNNCLQGWAPILDKASDSKNGLFSMAFMVLAKYAPYRVILVLAATKLSALDAEIVIRTLENQTNDHSR